MLTADHGIAFWGTSRTISLLDAGSDLAPLTNNRFAIVQDGGKLSLFDELGNVSEERLTPNSPFLNAKVVQTENHVAVVTEQQGEGGEIHLWAGGGGLPVLYWLTDIAFGIVGGNMVLGGLTTSPTGQLRISLHVEGAESNSVYLADLGYPTNFGLTPIPVSNGASLRAGESLTMGDGSYVVAYSREVDGVQSSVVDYADINGINSTSYISHVGGGDVDIARLSPSTFVSVTSGAGLLNVSVIEGRSQQVHGTHWTSYSGEGSPKVTALKDGGFLVAWTQKDDTANIDVVMQRFDALANPIGGIVNIPQGPSEDVLQDIETLSDGRVAITFLSGTSADRDLKVQIIDPRSGEIAGTRVDDVLVAGVGDTVIRALDGNDRVRGMGGDDALYGDAGSDTLAAGGGDDLGLGGSGNDVIIGQSGDDQLYGGSGNDALTGGADADFVSGGSGNDTLTGGASRDVLFGGTGADVFDFNTRLDSGLTRSSQDVIRDFSDGEDLIDLSSIDAIAAVAGNQSFRLIGQAAIGTQGEVRIVPIADGFVVEVNFAGGAAPDLTIRVLGAATLDESDFIL
jgi:Ca2+-binding RTX toxin-like protein